MTHFLSEPRRENLKAALIKLSMPETLADEFTSFPDDVKEIDRRLAATTSQSADYARRLAASEVNEEIAVLTVFILTCITIMNAYKDEARDRKLTGKDLPLWLSIAKEAASDLAEVKDALTKVSIN